MLNGTSDDDLLTNALYSRTGGTATRKGGAVDTAFRKGSLVWYLSPETGAPNPFQYFRSTLNNPRKRRRRTTGEIISSDSEEEKRPKIKLKIKLGPLPRPSAVAFTESNPSSTITPSSSTLRLPPYPIQSHCRHLLNIPNSPFDLPEYASPPPDSEDDFDDFHSSMMAAVNGSDSELPPPSIKDESDSDFDEDSFGVRSRSTSWTTVADPKTPRDVDKPLTQPYKVEGVDDTWDHDIFVKREEGSSDLEECWSNQREVDNLISFDEPFLLPLISKLEGPGDEIMSGHVRNRSFSAPITWNNSDFNILTPSPGYVASDDDLDLGPDSVPPEEFDKCHWPCRTINSAIPDSVLPNMDGEKLKTPPFRFVSVNGERLCELAVDGHILRKRVEDHTIHLTSLLRLLSSDPPSGDFMELDGASHIKDGNLKGTWVPLAFARNLVKCRTVSQELAEFLEESSITEDSDDSSLESFFSLDLTESKPLKEVTSSSKDKTIRDQVHFDLPPVTVTIDEPIWRRDASLDWKLNLELDSTLSLPRLPSILRTSPHTELHALHTTDSPLSPQEEEIFHSLVDLGTSKLTEQERMVEQTEENVLEADDEQDSPKQLRRSKRVAARSVPKTPLNTTRRSARVR